MTIHQAVIDSSADRVRSISLEPFGKLDPWVLKDFEDNPGHPIVIRFEGSSDLPTRLAFLSWAFLALFDRFGYAYALAPCSKPVRESLLTRRPAFGKGFFVQIGDLEERFRRMEIGISSAARPIGDDDFDPDMTGLGVLMEHCVLVTVPTTGDPDGGRLAMIAALADDGDAVTGQVISVPFSEVFPGTDGLAFLGVDQRFHLRREDGGLETVVGTTREGALALLVEARPPVVRRRAAAPAVEPVPRNWEARIPPLPARVAPDTWASFVVGDVTKRLADEGHPNDLVQRFAEGSSGLSTDELLTFAERELPPHLASHVRDVYELLLVGTSPRALDRLRGEEVLRRVRALLDAAGCEHAGMAFTSNAIAADLEIALHALLVVHQGRELLVGGYYTEHTALLAALVRLPRWLASSTEHEGPT